MLRCSVTGHRPEGAMPASDKDFRSQTTLHLRLQGLGLRVEVLKQGLRFRVEGYRPALESLNEFGLHRTRRVVRIGRSL